MPCLWSSDDVVFVVGKVQRGMFCQTENVEHLISLCWGHVTNSQYFNGTQTEIELVVFP